MRLQIEYGDHVDRGNILDVVFFRIYVLYFESIILSVWDVPGQGDSCIIYVDRMDRSDWFRI